METRNPLFSSVALSRVPPCSANQSWNQLRFLLKLMSDWESRTLTISDWVLEFQAIDGTHDTPTSVEESLIEKEFILESSIMHTPAKRKKGPFGGKNMKVSTLLGRTKSMTGRFLMILVHHYAWRMPHPLEIPVAN